MNKDEEKKSIENLGEFGLIEHLTSTFTQELSKTVTGVGDDCAVIDRNENEYTLISKELFLEKIRSKLLD